MSVIQPTECQCKGPGYCPLMKRNMSDLRHNECQNKPHYFEMFLRESGKDKGRPLPAPQRSPATGPGVELKGLLQQLGLFPKQGCGCDEIAAKMNMRGPQWCRENVDSVIVPHMRQEASRRGLPFSKLLARRLVLMAIKKAETR